MHGMKPFAEAELRRRLGASMRLLPDQDAEAIRFAYGGDWRRCQDLRLVNAVYLAAHFPIPRPKALLGHQHWHKLLRLIAAVRALHPPRAFRTCHVSAAGRQSTILRRLQQQLAADTGLTLDETAGDLWLRLRPAASAVGGWDMLVRLTPRPLSTRFWRVRDMEGALGGPVAALMVDLTQPQATDRFLNLTCGSGTLLVERLLTAPAALAVGTDLDAAHLQLARANLAAAGAYASLMRQDDGAAALAAGAFDAIVADLPWGQLVGEAANLPTLYARVIASAARLARPGARFVLITHMVQVTEQTLAQQENSWRVLRRIPLRRGNLRPRIYVLERRNNN